MLPLSLSVLVVDDSLIMQQKVSAMLREFGHTIAGTARSGAEAIRLYRERIPDLVSMDITMPDMDGIEATKHILTAYPSAVIIMVTSHGQENMVLAALDAGAKGYVLKPVNKERLGNVLDKVVKQYF